MWIWSSPTRRCSSKRRPGRLERVDGPLAARLLFHDQLGVVQIRSQERGDAGRVVEVFAAQLRQLWNPLANERTVRVELFALADGVEHSEIRRGIGAGGGRPLPAPVVAGKVVVDKVLGKEPFAPAPIHQQVFGEELGGHHAQAVVHPAGGHQAALGGIDQWVAGSSFAPGLELIFVVAPFDRFG